MAQNVWNDVAAGWKAWWPVIDAAGKDLCARLVQMAGVKPGDRVIDLATGAGEPALTACRAAGARGFVLGVDSAPDMLAFARERADSLGVKNVSFRDGDIENLDPALKDFDAALCRWGLMFVSDLERTLARIKGLIKPEGRFAAAVWSAPEKVPMSSLGMDELRKKFGLDMESWRPAGCPDPTRLADPEIMLSAFRKAGFKNVSWESAVVTFEWESAEAYADYRRTVSAALKGLLAGKSPDTQNEIIGTLVSAAKKHCGPGGRLSLSNETVCYSASAA